LLDAMPALPTLPKVGRKVTRRYDVTTSKPSLGRRARCSLAFELARSQPSGQ